MKIKNKIYLHAAVFSICLLGIFLVGRVFAENKFRLKDGARGDLCLSCHEGLKKKLVDMFMHPLLKKGECTGCHDPHTCNNKHLLVSDAGNLCYGCHEKNLVPLNSISIHKVVAERKCGKCHDSHASENKHILLKNGNRVCLDCHQDVADRKGIKFGHKPVDNDKGCLNCHNPHASVSARFLLKDSVPSLCVKCHETDKPSFSSKHMGYPVADTNCASCHDAHGSGRKGMLFENTHEPVIARKCSECHGKASPSRTMKRTEKLGVVLCEQCHKEMIEKTLDKNKVHGPLLDKRGCLNCHSPHASKNRNLLDMSIRDICGKCHQDTVRLQMLSIDNPKNRRLCEPIKKGDCTVCHSPHSSDNLLRVPGSSISRDLCGSCHKGFMVATHPIGEKIIDYRNKSLKVECLSCHKACGTGNMPDMLHFGTVKELCIQCHVYRRR